MKGNYGFPFKYDVLKITTPYIEVENIFLLSFSYKYGEPNKIILFYLYYIKKILTRVTE